MDPLERDLRAALRGDVRFDAVSRSLYAADASIYQVEPRGVAVPRDDGDLLAAVRLARRHGAPITARGGATSLAGQSVGAGLQLDLVPYFDRVRAIDPAARRAVVQPGVVLETLNQALLPHGLWFAPDVSPANRATIGGMIGNNSCGMHSIVYGKTIDHVEALDVILSDGTLIRAAPLSESDYAAKLAQPGREGEIYRGLRGLIDERRAEIAARFPPILRRVGGYNLDRLAASPTCNLVDLLVGSEGTLALTRQATLRLAPRPAVVGTCVLHFRHLFDAVDAVAPILAWQPAAVELMDALLLRLADQSPVYGPLARQFVRGSPGAVLMIEFFGDEPAAVRERCLAFAAAMARDGLSATATIAVAPGERAAILAVRKASLPLLMAMAPDRKPQTCVEDSAVAPERLGAYVRRFAAIIAAHGTEASFNGHASVGLLHVRPFLNLGDPADIRKLRSLAEAVRDLALEFGGAVSGEHGDGRLRSEFNERIFGPELYAAFGEVKRLFDPANLLNPGVITAAPPLDANLRPPPRREIATTYRFADVDGLANAVELCNGNGLCRKPSGGTMCPSFMATRQEQDSTRGRANALRAIVSGALPAAELHGDGLHGVLDLCLECKACTAECPSGVNMTRLKSEALSQRQAVHGVPLRSRLFGAARLVNRLGAAAAPVSNWLLGAPGAGWLQERLLGIARQRRLPPFARQTFFDWWRVAQRAAGPPPGAGRSGTVVLFPDTWTSYGEPAIAIAAVRVLWAAGYEVLLPARPVCCGRPLLSKGLLDGALRLARQQLEWLAPYAAAGLPIIGLEPSCILSFRDEYPDLLDDPRTAALARESLTFEEFVAAEQAAGRWALALAPQSKPLLLHQHCHAKALAAPGATLAALRSIPGADARELDAGCCGMAGSFGYEREHYALSLVIGERALLPAARQAPDALLVAPGVSCRQQLAHGAGRRAYHPAEILAALLPGAG